MDHEAIEATQRRDEDQFYANRATHEPTGINQIRSVADSVYGEFGQRAPLAQQGETDLQYRIRIANDLATKSAPYRKFELHPNTPSNDLVPLEQKIYGAALKQSKHPLDLPAGELRQIRKVDQSGRESFEFVAGGNGRGAFAKAYQGCTGPALASYVHVDGTPQPTTFYRGPR